MLLMVEKRMRSVICHAIHQFSKLSNKHMKHYDILMQGCK